MLMSKHALVDANHSGTQVLEGLLEEDDSTPDVWYLLAMCLRGGGELADALDAVQRGHAAAMAAGHTSTYSQYNFEELKVCAQSP